MKTTISLLVLFGLVLGGGYWYSQQGTAYAPEQAAVPTEPSDATVTSTTTTTTTISPTVAPVPTKPTPTPTPAPGTYTLAQVATHNTGGNCWSAINGSVYDLTSWVNQHPGGAGRILSICGKDGSQAFDGQHGGDPRAASVLGNFKVGVLSS